jgi:membrane protein DedA with SNARE-associated domain/membrane-associated phospholipid phosphatase
LSHTSGYVPDELPNRSTPPGWRALASRGRGGLEGPQGLNSGGMQQVVSLIEQYGYLVVFFGVLLESTGVPLPGETILLASGFLAQRGHIDVGDAIAFGILGAVVGDQIGYWVGREGGRSFVLRWGRYTRITPERLARAEAFFDRHGGKAVFLARFFAGLRVFGALVAGMSRLRWRTFVFYNVLGGSVWATAVVLVGYLAGGSLSLVERWLGRATLVLAGMLAVLVGFYVAYRWIAAHRTLLISYADAVLSYPPVARLRERYDTQLRWLLRRLTPGQYLGLHLTFGLAAAAGCLWLFGGLAEDVITGDPLVRFDQSTAAYLHSLAIPPLTTFFLVVTALGSIETIALLGMIVAAVLAKRRQWVYLGTWIAAVGGSVVLDRLLKELFARPRPVFAHPLLLETSYSFPSGHAMESLVVYGMLAYFAVLALVRSWRARTAVVFGAVLLVLLIGFSRLYLGVHYFSDVVAGYAAGGVWLSALITGAETIRRSKKARSPDSQADI